jgi:hypothetical protein
MRQSNRLRQRAYGVLGMAAMTLLMAGADEPKQTIDAGGLKFEAPKSWTSSPPPGGGMRVAQLKVEPIEGDDYTAEMLVYVFRPSAGSVEANLKRWEGWFKDKEGNQPTLQSKKVKGKNVEVTRAETHGDYQPPQFPNRPAEAKRSNARFLGAIVPGEGATYYIRMVGPDKTMSKLRPDFDALLASMQVDAK